LLAVQASTRVTVVVGTTTVPLPDRHADDIRLDTDDSGTAR